MLPLMVNWSWGHLHNAGGLNLQAKQDFLKTVGDLAVLVYFNAEKCIVMHCKSTSPRCELTLCFFTRTRSGLFVCLFLSWNCVSGPSVTWAVQCSSVSVMNEEVLCICAIFSMSACTELAAEGRRSRWWTQRGEKEFTFTAVSRPSSILLSFKLETSTIPSLHLKSSPTKFVEQNFDVKNLSLNLVSSRTHDNGTNSFVISTTPFSFRF